jgi:large subunit ribosomal protein L13
MSKQMPSGIQKSFMPTAETFEHRWFVVDVEGKTLGRVATHIASVLRGKHRATFAPHMDAGDFVVVVNADKVKLTGNKLADKPYYDHTGFPGGLYARSAQKLLERKPEELVRRAVWGMLPKGPLGRRIFKKLKVYAAATHPHTAQNPTELKLG